MFFFFFPRRCLFIGCQICPAPRPEIFSESCPRHRSKFWLSSVRGSTRFSRWQRLFSCWYRSLALLPCGAEWGGIVGKSGHVGGEIRSLANGSVNREWRSHQIQKWLRRGHARNSRAGQRNGVLWFPYPGGDYWISLLGAPHFQDESLYATSFLSTKKT